MPNNFIQVADAYNKIRYVNVQQICYVSFMEKSSAMILNMSSGENILCDYNILFPYPARKINYRTWIEVQTLVGKIPTQIDTARLPDGGDDV